MTHSPSPALTPDPEVVRRLVAEVLRRIGASAPGSAAAPAALAQPGAVVASIAPPAGGVLLAERVITLAVIEKLPPGTRQAAIAADAVLTPSARDRAQELGIALVRAPAAGAQAGAAAPPRPFLVAHAACTVAPLAKTAAIARAVPGVQQLPASGLADVVASLAVQVVRDGGRGILLTSRPATALVLANRQTGLRAVGGPEVRAVLVAAAECAANLLVVDPAAFAVGLERLCTEFAGRPDLPAPAELAAPAASTGHAGCSCTHGGPR
jgi:hypothetical protein